MQKPLFMADDKQRSEVDGKPLHSSNDGTDRGYNEKNPTQPQGAFEPDAADEPPKPNNQEEVRKSGRETEAGTTTKDV
jgi:hypothetical protein